MKLKKGVTIPNLLLMFIFIFLFALNKISSESFVLGLILCELSRMNELLAGD